MPDDSKATARDFLAVERTFLAWIRTGLALMGLGFVQARHNLPPELLRNIAVIDTRAAKAAE